MKATGLKLASLTPANWSKAIGIFSSLICLWGATARAELQFDVFIGYDGIVREANWFPVVCEVDNDGPSFTGTFEFSSGQFGAGQTRRLVTELPTNTRKRFVIPVYSAGRYSMWHARLLNERGKVIKELTNLRPKRDALAKNFVMGAVPRSFGGLPAFPETRPIRPEAQPTVCHLRPELFPDNPIALEGLDAIYVNTEKALELKANQSRALVDWIQAGGHLVVGLEQPGDINGLPWLRSLLPCEFTGVTTKTMQGEMQSWLTEGRADSGMDATGRAEAVSPPVSSPMVVPNRGRAMGPQATRRYGYNPGLPQQTIMSPVVNPFANLKADPAFDSGTLPLAHVNLHEGRVVYSLTGTPLIINIARGRGQVTVLAFSPEREPFRSWKNRAWFWAKVMNLPFELISNTESGNYSGWSIDGVFGSMIDSKQVRKLPVSWLLLLLLIYLAVIGPVDQYCLKKMNKQMLTWVTFPIYVVLFSGLIYFIGYKLRAGETEYNELHLVDILPAGDKAALRGRTYASVYSPSNAKFRLAGEQQFATLRGESERTYGGSSENSRAEVEHRGNGYRAEIFVPVWTSQLFVNDWWQPADLPISATLAQQGSSYKLTVKNLLSHSLTQARLALNHRIYVLGELESQQTKTFTFERNLGGIPLRDFVQQNANQFQMAAQERRQAFGSDPSLRLWDMPVSTMAASFLGELDRVGNNRRNFYASTFLAPEGLDLTPLVDRGDAVLLAWDAGDSLIQPIQQFTPRRSRRDTLLRLAIPLPVSLEKK